MSSENALVGWGEVVEVVVVDKEYLEYGQWKKNFWKYCLWKCQIDDPGVEGSAHINPTITSYHLVLIFVTPLLPVVVGSWLTELLLDCF